LILVDTSVWVDHLGRGDLELTALLESAAVQIHPFVIGEIACGSLSDRDAVIELLRDLPAVTVADDEEVLHFLSRSRLYGKGLGYIDVHLLAATALTPGARLWTRDKRLRAAAKAAGCGYGTTAH
jgi:predicted nucleic acid-binding protein